MVGPMPTKRMLHLLEQLLRGLDHAHSLGLVHRDLKPDNVIVVPSEGVELVKLLDFGVAKLANDKRRLAQTEKGQLLGTPMYIAPEQASNANDVSFASSGLVMAIVGLYRITNQWQSPGHFLANFPDLARR